MSCRRLVGKYGFGLRECFYVDVLDSGMPRNLKPDSAGCVTLGA